MEAAPLLEIRGLEQEDPGAACVVCGKPGTERATWAKSY